MAYKLKLERGGTFSEPMQFKSDGVAGNLTGKTMVFRLRESSSDTPYLTLSTDAVAPNANGSRLVYTNQATGAFTLTLTDEETALITFEAGVYSFSLEYGGAKFHKGGGAVVIITT